MKGKIDQLSPEIKQSIEAAKEHRLNYILSSRDPKGIFKKDIEGKLIVLMTNYPEILDFQYHHAISRSNIQTLEALFFKNPEIGEYILRDKLISDDQKEKIFTHIAKEYSRRPTRGMPQPHGSTEAALFSLQAMKNPDKTLFNEINYQAAVFYKQQKNYKEAIRCSFAARTGLNSPLLLAELLATQECGIPEDQKYLYCLYLLKEASSSPKYEKLIRSLLQSVPKTNELPNDLETAVTHALDKKNLAIDKAEKQLFIWLNPDKISLLALKHKSFFSQADLTRLPKEIESIVANNSFDLN